MSDKPSDRQKRRDKETRIFEYVNELEECIERLARTPGHLAWLQNLKREFEADMDDFDYDKIGDDS